jgi:hypothetical protein
MTPHQQQAFDHPLIGRATDGIADLGWSAPPWELALSFNR